MNESIHQYFRVGTLLWMSYPDTDPLVVLPRLLMDDYFDALEISHMEDPITRNRVRQMLEQSGIQLGHGAHPVILGRGLNPK